MSDSTNKTITIRIAIDIPVEIADTTLAKLEPMISQLVQTEQEEPRNQDGVGFVTPVDEEKRTQEKQVIEDRRQLYKRRIVQSYRQFRHLTKKGKTEKEALHQIALELNWPIETTKSITFARRKRINQYIRFRRMKTIIRLRQKGKTQTFIAKHVGTSQQTVNRVLKEARKQKVGGLS